MLPAQAKSDYMMAGGLKHIANIHHELSVRFADIDSKLDRLSMQLGGGLDNLSVHLAKLCTSPGRDYRKVMNGIGESPRESPHMHDGNARYVPGVGGSSAPQSPRAKAEDTAVEPRAPSKEERDIDDQMATNSFSSKDFIPAQSFDGTGSAPLKRKGSLDSSQMVLATAAALLQKGALSQGRCKRTMWHLLEDPDSGRAAFLFPRIWSLVIILSVLCTLVQTLQVPLWKGDRALTIGLCYDCLFTFELLLRYWVSPSTVIFIRNPHNVIDICATLPLVLRANCLSGALKCGEDSLPLAVLQCLVPSIQMLKLLRHFEQFHLFLLLINETYDALLVLYVLLFEIVLASGAVVYYVESRDNITSIPMAMYLIITTVSTVGYGDITPDSTVGTWAISFIILTGVLFLAMPIGIIGNAFTQIWSERDRILLTIRTRDRLTQWGYTAADIQMLFKHFDTDGGGELDLSEFRQMIAELKIGIRDDRVTQLFKSFDENNDGSIDVKELTKALFPSTFLELHSGPSRTFDDERSQIDLASRS